jgi:hypothetical protein
MIEQSDIKPDQELFTAYLTNSKDNVSPLYTFGYIDYNLIGQGHINRTSVDSSQGFWAVDSTSARVNDLDLALVGGKTIIDTGTTLCLIDDNTCRAIYEAIPGARYDNNQGVRGNSLHSFSTKTDKLQGYLFPSNMSPSQMPVVRFAIGNDMFTMHKQDLAFANAGNGMTYGGIQSRGNLNFSIYGCSVLKGMYAIFDQGKKQFGWVQKDDKSTTMENEATGHYKATPAKDVHLAATQAAHRH